METFRIDIPISVTDNTDPGVSSASKKVSAFDRVFEKMQSRVDKATKTKWKVTIEAVDKVTRVISTIGSGIKSVAGKVWSVTMSVVDKVTTPIKKMISVVGDLLGISTAASTVLAGLSIKNALTSAAESSRMMTQLNVSASNMGISDSGVQQIVNKASAMQGYTMYSGDAMIGSAAELATYFSDADAITRMMDVVADYAAGMSGGTELSTQEIVDYTTNLAKMTTGAYDAMTKKGFEVTDAQKAILESGTDMQQVAVIEEIIRENWDGMAEAMSNTPTGWLSRLKNAWDDVSKIAGNKLTPGVTSFLSMLSSKMPAVSSLIEDVAESAGSWFENLIPTLEEWIDDAITWVTNLKDKITEVFSSEEFKNADFFGKISIAWNEIIAEPFSEWWNSTGRAWFAEKAGAVGNTIGSGVTQGLLALLGIDLGGAFTDGKSAGTSFINGFKEGFDTEKITEALKTWADDHKLIVTALGAKIGLNLVTGMAGKIGSLIGKVKSFFGKGSNDTGTGSFNAAGKVSIACTSATVTASVVNVYGAVTNNGGSGAGDTAKRLFDKVSQYYLAKKATEGASQLLLGSGEAAAGAGAAEVGGAAAASAGGLTGFFGSIGTALGSEAATAGGAAAAGASGVGGALGILFGLISSGFNFYNGATAEDDKTAKTEYISGGTKLGMIASGAGIGAAIGSVVPGLGTAIGALVGGGIGGIGALLGGDGLGGLISDWTDEGGWMNEVGKAIGTFFSQTLPTFFTNAWSGISGFFTESIPNFVSNVGEGIGTFFSETIPEFFSGLWEEISSFFLDDIPYAIGYAVGSIEVFFTETIPQFFSDLWDGITTFFTDTLPSWLGTIWEGICTFFTSTLPQWFSEIWSGIVTFFTDTLPTWIAGVWDSICTFFTSTLPQWFSELWNGIVTFFTETLPTFIATAWEKVTTFFTVTVPAWFESLWQGIVNFVTNIIPQWVSKIGSIISGWGESIAGWFSSLWSSIQSFFSDAWSRITSAFGAGYSDAGGGKHAWGGIMNAPHYGVVAEDGPEAIIPLSSSKSDRALDLWMQAGRYLGVQPYADGDIVGDPAPVSIQTVPSGDGDSSGQKVQVIVTLSPDFIIQAAGADEESIMAIIRSHLRELADEVGGEIAEQLREIFSNMPIRGYA